jgi:putative transposase
MKYDPAKHHRRSILLKGYDYSAEGIYFITICIYQRECLFGEIVDGALCLNRFGKIINTHWANLTKHHPHVQLDEFVVMPNHIHGIIVLNPTVGAGFDDPPLLPTDSLSTKPALPPPSRSHISSPMHDGDHGDGVDLHFGRGRAGFGDHLDKCGQLSSKPAPTDIPVRQGISEIVRGFKTFSARQINKIRHTQGTPVWQRNYYEHIIRDETALQNIRRYVRNNPKSWQIDQLHPDNPSKW